MNSLKKVRFITYGLLVLTIVGINIRQFSYMVEIEDTELIMILGLDSSVENNNVKLTYLRNPIEQESSSNSNKKSSSNNSEGDGGEQSPESSGGEGSTSSIDSTTATISSSTYNLAMKKVQSYSDKFLANNFIRYYIIGEDTAKRGLLRETDFLSRDYDFRLNSKVFISKGISAEDILKKADKNLYEKLDNTINSTVQLQVLRDLSLIDILKSVNDDYNSAGVVPVIEEENKTGTKEINIYGLAVFKNDKLVDYLDFDEMITYSFLNSKVKAVTIDVEDPSFGHVSVRNRYNKQKT